MSTVRKVKATGSIVAQRENQAVLYMSPTYVEALQHPQVEEAVAFVAFTRGRADASPAELEKLVKQAEAEPTREHLAALADGVNAERFPVEPEAEVLLPQLRKLVERSRERQAQEAKAQAARAAEHKRELAARREQRKAEREARKAAEAKVVRAGQKSPAGSSSGKRARKKVEAAPVEHKQRFLP